MSAKHLVLLLSLGTSACGLYFPGDTGDTDSGVDDTDLLFVAAGDQGALASSPDGVTWTTRTSGTTVTLHDVTHGDGRYVAVGQGGKILVSEGAALRNLGVEPGQTVGYNAFELYGNPDSIANMHRALAGERLVAIAHEAGRTLETRFAPLRAPDGEIVGMTGITVDVTDARDKQAELERQTVALREQAELLDLAHDAILVRRLDGTITYWNRGAERIFGHTGATAVWASATATALIRPRGRRIHRAPGRSHVYCTTCSVCISIVSTPAIASLGASGPALQSKESAVRYCPGER